MGNNLYKTFSHSFLYNTIRGAIAPLIFTFYFNLQDRVQDLLPLEDLYIRFLYTLLYVYHSV